MLKSLLASYATVFGGMSRKVRGQFGHWLVRTLANSEIGKFGPRPLVNSDPAKSTEHVRPVYMDSLRKLAHAIYRDFFSAVKIENFIGKFLIFFLNLLNEYPQSMF